MRRATARRGLIVSEGLPALDQLFEQQKFLVDPEARQQVIWETDKRDRDK